MKIGILGGSFNPIHYGHLMMAKLCTERFGLDKCLLMVAAAPPHKKISDSVSAQTRFDIVCAALSEPGFDKICACDMEITRGGTSYTVDTLSALAKKYHGAELFLIMGADMLHSLSSWREPREICRLAHIAAVRRPAFFSSSQFKQDAQSLRETLGAQISLADISVPDISSTDIRQRVSEAYPIQGLLPYAAEEMIYRSALYAPADIRYITSDLRNRLSQKRFFHSISTMREAIILADRYGADRKKCRLSGLVHDCERITGADYIKLAHRYGIALDSFDLESPALIHAKTGALMLTHRYGIKDSIIIEAVRQHTLCAPNMTDVAKITYLADKTEALRSYPGVAELRNAAKEGLNKGMLACLEQSEERLLSMGKSMHPMSVEAKLCIKEEMKSGF